MLVQCARAAARKRGSYYGAQYQQLKARIGDQKAIIAVAASILTAIYHMLRDGTEHADLAAYLSRREGDSKRSHINSRDASRLGYQSICDGMTATTSTLVSGSEAMTQHGKNACGCWVCASLDPTYGYVNRARARP